MLRRDHCQTPVEPAGSSSSSSSGLNATGQKAHPRSINYHHSPGEEEDLHLVDHLHVEAVVGVRAQRGGGRDVLLRLLVLGCSREQEDALPVGPVVVGGGGDQSVVAATIIGRRVGMQEARACEAVAAAAAAGGVSFYGLVITGIGSASMLVTS